MKTRRLVWAAGLGVAMMVACGDSEDEPPTGGTGPGTTGSTGATGGGGQATTSSGTGGGEACLAEGPTVVTFATDDGLTLEGDLYATGEEAGPAAVLLHMNPAGGNDRGNFGAGFIDAVVAQGISVLNIDRRGAGNSEGVATEAFTGPNGKLDAKAAYDFLVGHPCAIDPGRVAYVGASNGSTTALDFAVFAETDPAVQLPGALVFLTGGAYTEAQNTIAGNLELITTLPILFVYSTAEAAWSQQFEGGAPPNWLFNEYADGAHGTGMFGAVPDSVDDVATYLDNTL